MKLQLHKIIAFVLILLVLLPTARANISDPTRPLTFKEALEIRCYQDNILLQSINYGQNKHIALINGEFYEVGNQIDLYKIIAMTPDSVTLERDNKTTVLTL